MQSMRFIFPVVFSILAIVGCEQLPNSESPQSNFQQVYESISEQELKQHVKTISSDEFEGRGPTTDGETKTLEYLVDNFKSLGFEPGNGNSYLQAVELMEITADPNMQLHMGKNTFEYQKNMVASSKRETPQVNLNDSEIVFVGYGVNAPEYNWNDYQGLDVKGKTVVILVNDPGFENPESGKFQGKTMTYYGRWTYKYEEASRQGAEAAIIVHETAPASYGWSVVSNSWSGPQYSLVSKNGNADRVAVEGWISLEAANKVFAEAGLDFSQQKAKAMQGPYSKALGTKASITVNSKLKKSVSNNVIATLSGSVAADEHIIYTAHWDHLGKDSSLKGDQIYNGAHDNATGVAASLTMAKAFSELSIRPARSITFLIVTAEEQGLLGSKYYSEHPIIPLDKTVANLNMDALNVLGRTKNVSVVGMGKSELEKYLASAVAKQGRFLTQEDRPEAGSYYRSDHFSFAKQGVPALYAKGGNQPIDEATAKYRKRANVVVKGCYHQVCDQFRENWDFGGIQEDTQMLFDVGYSIANSNDWPQWSKTSEFQR
ncbi:M28 family metallopeptidase [Aliiglaciecola sp. 3_MG-2023]|uniref:M28 family metallopeptidase n=1 Tax=Aliiglaciecola sp. 3_MG-2023 TaxID=3062644 RepID=UPI0026E407DB|nr:M28 family metallopeptidase [Aliiglaciecola sp. 3_MG-2023]MDO6695586.1 M28 family metallopeptidase [Aliiglaciecola sp. 3_MG-2023]